MTERAAISSKSPKGIGADIAAVTLAQLGVTDVFGLPGTQNVDLLESLAQAKIRFHSATQECAAGFMALGYARASGSTTVLTTIPGPGFTYALSAIAEAREDSVPLLYLLVGPEEPLREGALHALSHSQIASSLVKRYQLVDSAAALASTIHDGFLECSRGEPGPVIVEIAYRALRDFCATPDPSTKPLDETFSVKSEQLSQLQARMKQAARPLLFVGQGGAAAFKQIRLLSQQWNVPVVSTCSGRGIVSDEAPQFIPIDFAFGVSDAARELFQSSDFILALGCKLSHNGTGGFGLGLEDANIVEINTKYSTQLSPNRFGWRCEDFLDSLLAAPTETSSWSGQDISALRHKFLAEQSRPIPYPPTVLGITDDISSFFYELRAKAGDAAVFVTDAGLHQSLARRYLPVRLPRTLLCPIDFQAMGFGVPAAVGAGIALRQDRDRRVVAIVGDGALLCSGMELISAVREEIPLVVVVWNDGNYGSIYREQVRRYGRSYATELPTLNTERFARAVGMRYEKVEGDLHTSLGRVFERSEPVLAEVMIEDHPGLAVAAATSRMRATVRKTIGRRITRTVRSLVRR